MDMNEFEEMTEASFYELDTFYERYVNAGGEDECVDDDVPWGTQNPFYNELTGEHYSSSYDAFEEYVHFENASRNRVVIGDKGKTEKANPMLRNLRKQLRK